MPLQATSGAASYDGFGGGVAVVPAYIEDVMSTYVYTGTGATQTITNGIDTTTYGGLVWTKARYLGISHRLVDTARGATYEMSSDTTDASSVNSTGLTSFGTTGYTIGSAGGYNNSGGTYTSWSLRKQPKFFDVVTYTGNGTAGRTVAHNLGSVPGCIIVKITNAAGYDWIVYHRSTGNTNRLLLNDTVPAASGTSFWNDTTPTSTVFSVGNNVNVNQSGSTYVAYLFAHDAGGFGLTGTDNVISCGSYTTDGSGNATINLGYEPQWLLVKNTSAPASWIVVDNMRGFGSATDSTNRLNPNTSGAEITGSTPYYVTSTGFTAESGPSVNFIYIAIRRGPMKVPTLGTSVFSPVAYTGNSTTNTTVQNLTTNFAGDAVIIPQRTGGNNPLFFDKLRGGTKAIYTSLTLAEETITAGESVNFNNTQTVLTGQYTAQGNYNYSGDTFVSYNFQRAPSVFDIVCYTGTGVARTVTHNLTVAPELMIIKVRTPTGYAWRVYAAPLGVTQSLRLNTDNASETDTYWNGTAPTSTVFSVNNYGQVNNSGSPIVAYLFATCAGVSKVGSYTGTATTKQIDCGFTGGARFVLIKRTDSTGDWYVWDSARGIVAGNDPYLLLNSTAAEVTSTDYVDTYSAGFEISSTAPAAINASGGTFIFLAIA